MSLRNGISNKVRKGKFKMQNLTAQEYLATSCLFGHGGIKNHILIALKNRYAIKTGFVSGCHFDIYVMQTNNFI